jgi:hypothetical protein
VVAAVGAPDSPPRGLFIDASFNFGGGRCRSSRQHPLGGPPSTSPSTLVVAAAGDTDSTAQGANHRCLVKLGTYHQYFSGDTYQGTTAVNTTTASNTSFTKNISGFLWYQRSRKNNCKEVPSNKVQHNVIYWNKKREENCQQGGEAYASLSSRLNRSATARAASSTPTLAASADPSTGPCTTGNREMLGS